jgi:hypothetical protein
MEVRGLAPVPPEWPETWTTSAFAFATPAAMVPMPSSETNLTLTSASEFADFKSNINCLRSSME